MLGFQSTLPGSFVNSSSAFLHEIQELFHEGALGFRRLAAFFHGLTDIQIRAVKYFIQFSNAINGFLGDPVPLKANTIQSNDPGGIPIDFNKWRNVFGDFAHSANHDIATNMAKLMDSSEAAKNSPIPDMDMPCQSYAVGKNTEIANPAIVSNMDIGHEHIAVTNDGLCPFALGKMNSSAFAKMIAITDPDEAFFPTEFDVLRGAPDGNMRRKLVVGTNGSKTINETGMTHMGIGTNGHIRANEGVRSYHNGWVEGSLWGNDRGWMNIHGKLHDIKEW